MNSGSSRVWMWRHLQNGTTCTWLQKQHLQGGNNSADLRQCNETSAGNLAVFNVNLHSVAVCSLTGVCDLGSTHVSGLCIMMKHLVWSHLADRVSRFQRLQLFQTPVQLVQSLYGQLLVRLLCTTETQGGIMGWSSVHSYTVTISKRCLK